MQNYNGLSDSPCCPGLADKTLQGSTFSDLNSLLQTTLIATMAGIAVYLLFIRK